MQKRPTEPGVLLTSVGMFTPAEIALGGLQADFSQVNRIAGGAIGTIHKWFWTDSPRLSYHYTGARMYDQHRARPKIDHTRGFLSIDLTRGLTDKL